MPVFMDEEKTFFEKAEALKNGVKYNDILHDCAVADINGNMYTLQKQVIDASDRDWYKSRIAGKNFLTDPYVSRSDNKVIMTFCVPIFNESRKVIGMIGVAILSDWLSNNIADIVVGSSGECYILDTEGMTVAHKNKQVVESMYNLVDESKKDKSLESTASFLRHALQTDESEVGYYTYKGEYFIASFSTIKTTDWKVIIKAPRHEFLQTIESLKISMYGIGILILVISLIIIYIVERAIVRPINKTVEALHGIAMGEGYLTVRLPLRGNDEVTDLALYFNETIAKIALSIKTVDDNARVMEGIGAELASNMTETASSVHEISSNIESVKGQPLE